MSEAVEGVRVHLIGGRHDGQMLCGTSLPDVTLPAGYRMTPWPGGQSGIHWHRELNLACVYGSLTADALCAALGAQWRGYLATRRQRAAAGQGSERHDGCAETTLA